jgi:hypothetical protein
MRKWILALMAALVAPVPVLACMAIPMRPDNSRIEMKLTEQRALIYEKDGREHLILSVKYDGATSQFAWVIPTETQPTINVQKGATFHELWRLTEIQQKRPVMRSESSMPGAAGAGPPPVVVLERKVEGPYEMVVLKASESGGLYQWLRKNGFGLTPGARTALDYYVRKGWYFAAARIRPGGASNASIQQNLKQGSIAALHLSFKAKQLSYPLRVTTGNPGDSKMEIFVIGKNVRRPPLLQGLQFAMAPVGAKAFRVQGPPGLVHVQGDYPTLRELLPKGGTLNKFSGVMSTAQRNQDMVFSEIPAVAGR